MTLPRSTALSQRTPGGTTRWETVPVRGANAALAALDLEFGVALRLTTAIPSGSFRAVSSVWSSACRPTASR